MNLRSCSHGSAKKKSIVHLITQWSSAFLAPLLVGGLRIIDMLLPQPIVIWPKKKEFCGVQSPWLWILNGSIHLIFRRIPPCHYIQ